MRASVVSFVIVALLISAALASAQGLTLRTGDGLVLELSGAGEVTAAQIGAAKLPLAGAGGFSIADFHNQPEPENMVANPGFEQGAEGWNLRDGQSIDEKIFHTGKRAVRLVPLSCRQRVIDFRLPAGQLLVKACQLAGVF